MAKTIKVTASQVRKYVNHSSVCSSWKNDIKSKFDLYSTQEEFTVDVAFIKKAIEAAPSVSLRNELKRDFDALIKATETVEFAQTKKLVEEGTVMAGVEICGASARNSLLPEAAGRGLFLDGSCEYLIRETKKGNYLIIPVKAGSPVPSKFKKLNNIAV